MIKHRNCYVLTAVIQVIFGQFPRPIPRELRHLGIYHPYQQRIPRYCWQPPQDIDRYKCCPVPNFYSDEVLDFCGIEKSSGIGRSYIKDSKKLPCQDGLCLMGKANLLATNSTIDYEKLGTYVYQWAAANPTFTEAILIAKPLCVKEKGKEWNRVGPPKLCDPDRIFMCLQAHIYWNCNMTLTEDCERLREHRDECKPYYFDPHAIDKKSE